MSTVDDLMALAQKFAAAWHTNQSSRVVAAYDDESERKTLRAALESALRAEYERGRSERKLAFVGCDDCVTPRTCERIGKCANNTGEREQDAEPVAWAVYDIEHGGSVSLHLHASHCEDGDETRFRAVPLYASPPKRKRLTDEQIDAMYLEVVGPRSGPLARDFARAIERAHGIGDE
jgi:hypothetical protein